MKILIDMNLSPSWCDLLVKRGFEAVHWTEVGNPDDPDQELFRWALDNDHIVFTHDLDFGAILAATGANAPSVLQIRTQDVHPDSLGEYVISLLKEFASELEQGALISADRERSRIRMLPLT